MRIRQVTSVFWLFAASTSLLAGTISLQPTAPTKTVGQSFTLSVVISGASDLYGYQFDLGFDPTVLKATSVTEGAFLGTGGPTIFLPGTIDNVGGSITANADILNGAKASAGPRKTPSFSPTLLTAQEMQYSMTR